MHKEGMTITLEFQAGLNIDIIILVNQVLCYVSTSNYIYITDKYMDIIL